MFDFDEVIDRRGTHSVKWDGMAGRFGLTDPDIIPMWVADMDFKCPPAVNDALHAMADHGVHGYFGDDAEMKAAVIGWMTRRHRWTPAPDWIMTTPGLVSAVGMALAAFTEPGGGVAVFSPVYHAFGNVIRAGGRRICHLPLANVQGRYEMDFERAAAALEPDVKIILISSPHNPGGRVWTQDELRALGAFCIEHDLIVVSDEVHHDLVFPGATHHVTANVMPELVDRLVTLVAPSKTFNLAGCQTGFVIVEDAALRERFNAMRGAMSLYNPNRFGAVAATAAYAHGDGWLDALIPYLVANRDHFHGAVAEHLPGVRAMELESTYLSWLDFSGTGLSPDEAADRVNNRAKIAVNRGPTFGPGGESFLRFNFACPRATLDTAIARMVDVFGRQPAEV